MIIPTAKTWKFCESTIQFTSKATGNKAISSHIYFLLNLPTVKTKTTRKIFRLNEILAGYSIYFLEIMKICLVTWEQEKVDRGPFNNYTPRKDNLSLLWLKHKEIFKYPSRKQLKSVNYDHLTIMNMSNLKQTKSAMLLIRSRKKLGESCFCSRKY